MPKDTTEETQIMRYRNKRRVFCWILMWSLRLVLCEDVTTSESNNPVSKDLHGLFAPRMDYDQWKPLGRGDPLKNDPTYDYVPPVLDRVHYWIDPALRKPDPPTQGDSQKTEILLLGVSSKKPSTGTSVADSRKDNYDSFLKFVDGPKFTQPHYPYFPPSMYKNKGGFPKASEQRMPYTMLMPPPMVTSKPETTTDSVTTTISPVTYRSDVTVQAANLVYHSSSSGNGNEWKSTETSTILTPNPAVYATKRLKPFKDEIVFQKHLQPPESYVQLQFSSPQRNLTNQPLVAANSDHKINYVTPPPLVETEIMHKGQVSDDNLDISNTYVKIGKTEAQMHSTAIDNIPDMLIHHMLTQTPLTMQTLQTMQNMQPPPVTTSPVFKKSTNPIRLALDREVEPTTTTTTTPPTTTVTTLTTDPLFKHHTEPVKSPSYLIIQGHSKVKTYGPSKQIHGIRVQETNEISDDKDEVSLKRGFLQGGGRAARSGNLQTLKHVVQTRLGAIDFGDDGVKEAELQFGYKVGEDATSETYHKGFVEEARKLHMEA